MAALSILNVKFIALGLSLELAGYYNSAYGYLQLFGILADFGLYAVSVREMSRSERRDEVLSALIFLRTIILTLSLGSAIAIVWILPAWQGTPLPLGVTFAAFVPFFTLLAGTLRSVFQVHYQLRYVFIAEVTQRVITTVLLGIIVFLGIRGSTNVNLYLYCTLTGGVGAFVLLLISYTSALRFTRITAAWHSATMRHLLRSALPFGCAYVLISVCRQFDTTMIALLRPDFDVQNAYYGFVLRMADMAFLIPTFLLNSTLPVVSERQTQGEDASVLLGKTFLILLVLGSISFLFSLLWPRPLIALLTTERYLSTASTPGADTALSLISIPMFFNGMILFSFYVFLVSGIWRRLLGTLAVGAVVSIVCNFFLIPRFGFVGAAMTAVIVHSLLALLLLPQVFLTTSIRFPRHAFMRWAVFCLLVGSMLWLIRPLLVNDIATVFALGAMTVVLCLALVITGIFRMIVGLPRHSHHLFTLE